MEGEPMATRQTRSNMSTNRSTKNIHPIQKCAWAYAASFLGIVILDFVPGLRDARGLLFGLFVLLLVQDLLHFVSFVWAASAARHSARQAMLYFVGFGTYYSLDALLGLLTGAPGVPTILVNLPHTILGSMALYIGFVYGPRSGAWNK